MGGETADLREHVPAYRKVRADRRARTERGRLVSIVEHGDWRAQPWMPIPRAANPRRHRRLPTGPHRSAEKRNLGIGHRIAYRVEPPVLDVHVIVGEREDVAG